MEMSLCSLTLWRHKRSRVAGAGVLPQSHPTHGEHGKCWDVAGRQGHSRLLGFPCDLGGDLTPARSPVPRRLSHALPCPPSCQVLKRQGYDEGCDIWSLGILLYTMLAG